MRFENKEIEDKIEELENIIHSLLENKKMTEEEIITYLNNPIIQLSKKNNSFTEKKTHKSEKYEISIEHYLQTMLSEQFAKLNKEDNIEKQVDDFIKYIEFSDNEIVKQAFISAYKMNRNKISYSTILAYMCTYFTNIKREEIEKILKEEYKKWEAKNPEIRQKYGTSSIISLLKVFRRNTLRNMEDV